MVMPGETIQSTTTTCMDCGSDLTLKVYCTCAPYLGFSCPVCGPYSRETKYFDTLEEAEEALESGNFEWR